MTISRGRIMLALHMQCFPNVSREVVDIRHLALTEALPTYHVQGIKEHQSAMARRSHGREGIFVGHCLPIAFFGQLTAIVS